MRALFTIGYEGTDIDRLVETLKTVGIKVLADVRAVAISRKKGFSKSALRTRLESEGITYVHFVELGDPKSGREAARAGNYDKFRRVYSKHLKTKLASGALHVLGETVQQERVCLLCFERDPATCHRTMIADRLKAHGFTVLDLYGDEPGRYVRHAEKLPSRHPHQGDAEPQPEVW
jgi:uncharacterized protein (DUF488 family)